MILFVCFVDLQKAFDSVWRNGLLFKLVKIGVGKQLYNIVKQQLSKTETAFKFENSHSNFPIYVIESYMIYSIALDSDPILKLN
jgi:hypothetical protein